MKESRVFFGKKEENEKKNIVFSTIVHYNALQWPLYALHFEHCKHCKHCKCSLRKRNKKEEFEH